MIIKNQIGMCTEHYTKWKRLALSANSLEESKRCLEKAFFWLELQTAFITLFAAERSESKNSETKSKLVAAKANLSSKLADYAKEILKELGS